MLELRAADDHLCYSRPVTFAKLPGMTTSSPVRALQKSAEAAEREARNPTNAASLVARSYFLARGWIRFRVTRHAYMHACSLTKSKAPS